MYTGHPTQRARVPPNQVIRSTATNAPTMIDELRPTMRSTTQIIKIILCWLFSCAGCIYQVKQLSEQYLGCETAKEFTITRELAVVSPTTSICFKKYTQVIQKM